MVDFPKAGLARSRVTVVCALPVAGLPRFTRLNALKASRRSNAVTLSVTTKVFASERSVCANPGPGIVLRPRLPSVPGVGAVKSETLKMPV